MNKNQEDYLEVLRKINKSPDLSQREIAKELGFSLGKLNYVLKALKDKGYIKIKNFQKQKNKSTYIRYVLTSQGITKRINLTINFMKIKIREYEQLKSELKK